MHRAIYLHRKDIQAIVHTHSTYATMFACAGVEIPAVHYLLAEIGDQVPVAPYALFGTEELAQNVIHSLQKANGVLLANHGVVAVGTTIEEAFRRAEAIEMGAHLALGAKMLGKINPLSTEELEQVRAQFANYFQAKVAK
jgi:L-fuculose-phosphate aldolase